MVYTKNTLVLLKNSETEVLSNKKELFYLRYLCKKNFFKIFDREKVVKDISTSLLRYVMEKKLTKSD